MNILFYVSCFLFCSITASNNSKCTLPTKSTKSRLKTTQKFLKYIKTFETLPPITKKKYNGTAPISIERLCTVPEIQVLFTKDQPGNSPRPGNDSYRKRPKFSLPKTNRGIVEENERQIRENIYTPSSTDISFAGSLVNLINHKKYQAACKQLKDFPSLCTVYVAQQAQQALDKQQNQKKLDNDTCALRLLITEKMRENQAEEHF